VRAKSAGLRGGFRLASGRRAIRPACLLGSNMYLPENDAQMRDILLELRLYAQMHGLPILAEELDDALHLLACELRRRSDAAPEAPRAGDLS
jgi:hypothetical protein